MDPTKRLSARLLAYRPSLPPVCCCQRPSVAFVAAILLLFLLLFEITSSSTTRPSHASDTSSSHLSVFPRHCLPSIRFRAHLPPPSTPSSPSSSSCPQQLDSRPTQLPTLPLQHQVCSFLLVVCFGGYMSPPSPSPVSSLLQPSALLSATTLISLLRSTASFVVFYVQSVVFLVALHKESKKIVPFALFVVCCFQSFVLFVVLQESSKTKTPKTLFLSCFSTVSGVQSIVCLDVSRESTKKAKKKSSFLLRFRCSFSFACVFACEADHISTCQSHAYSVLL